MNRLLAYLFAGILLASAAPANAQIAVSIPSLATEKPANLNGYPYIPEGAGPFPAVVLMHGCAGIGQNVKNWARFLQTRGYMALVLDSLTTRSISEVCTNLSRLTIADRAGDAFGALKYLQSLPNVDKYRIGIIGFSHGAVTVLKTVSESTAFPLGDAPNYAAASALYPDCLSSEVDANVPLLIHSGERDDWTAAAPCQLKAAARKSEGYPVEIEVYAGALHSFDNPDVKYYYGGTWMNPNKPKFCCGASVGYSYAAREKAEKNTEAFFARHLRPTEPASTRAWTAKPSTTRDEVADLVRAAKAYAVVNGKDKLIGLIGSQDAQFRKRRQYLALIDNQGICLAHGRYPVGFAGFDFSKILDLEKRPYIDAIRAALEKNPPWGNLRSQDSNNDIYVERLDDDTIVVGYLMK
jgi:dienelactone hydrolase